MGYRGIFIFCALWLVGSAITMKIYIKTAIKEIIDKIIMERTPLNNKKAACILEYILSFIANVWSTFGLGFLFYEIFYPGLIEGIRISINEKHYIQYIVFLLIITCLILVFYKVLQKYVISLCEENLIIFSWVLLLFFLGFVLFFVLGILCPTFFDVSRQISSIFLLLTIWADISVGILYHEGFINGKTTDPKKLIVLYIIFVLIISIFLYYYTIT